MLLFTYLFGVVWCFNCLLGLFGLFSWLLVVLICCLMFARLFVCVYLVWWLIKLFVCWRTCCAWCGCWMVCGRSWLVMVFNSVAWMFDFLLLNYFAELFWLVSCLWGKAFACFAICLMVTVCWFIVWLIFMFVAGVWVNWLVDN